MAAAAIVGGISAAIPVVVKLVELFKGGKKASADTQTGKEKLDTAVALLQLLSGLNGQAQTTDSLIQQINDQVAIMNALGQLPKAGGAVSVIFTGQLTYGGQK